MRFIFLTLGYHPDRVGGAYRYVTELSETLAARGHKVQVIFPAPTSTPLPVETRVGVELHRLPNAEGFFWNNWRRENAAARGLLKSLFARDTSPALVGLHHAFYGRAVPQAGCPSVFLCHGPWSLEFEFARQAGSPAWPRRLANGLIARVLHAEEGRALRRARNVFTASHYMAEMLPRWHGAELPPVKVVFGGVNAGRFQPAADRVAVRKKLRLSPEDFLFVAVRRLDPRMGLLTLLDGFAAVTGEFPNARLCLAGTGPQRDELESRIRSLGLGEQVRLAGFVPEPELPELLSAADCTLMPSLDLEGFGLATVESLACGTPVLGSRAGGTPELLAPLSEKLIFDAGSANALAAKLREILSNPGSLPSREQCRDYAVKNFSWDRVASAFEESLTELCPAGGGA